MAALQELLYGDPALPEGAVPHLLGLPKEQRGVLDHLLKEFKGVFPPELPKNVPPDRVLGDVHEIPVKAWHRAYFQEDVSPQSQGTAFEQEVALRAVRSRSH